MATVVLVPRINANDARVDVLFWHAADRAFVAAGDRLVDLGTSKATFAVVAPTSGYVVALHRAGTRTKVGDALAEVHATLEELDEQVRIRASASSAGTTTPLTAAQLANAPPSTSSQAVRLSKAAERYIAAHGLDAARFAGRGLVTLEMVKRTVGDSEAQQLGATSVSISAASVPHEALPGVRSESVSLAKQAEIDALTIGAEGNIVSALTVHFDSAPLRQLLAVENRFDGQLLPVLLYELAHLLRAAPRFTAFFANDAIHMYDRVDIGVAMDLGHGLKVITIAHADELLPMHLHTRLIESAQRYLEQRLETEELQDSTFTVTDLSGFDIPLFHPIINGRQSAILGVGGDSTKPGHPMSLTIAFDHRVLTGRDVAILLGELKRRLMSYCEGEPRRADDDLPPAAKIHCDRCFIDLERYYAETERGAAMLLYIRPDGTTAALCHLCASGHRG